MLPSAGESRVAMAHHTKSRTAQQRSLLAAKALSVTLLLLVHAASSATTTFYVATNGSDTNEGTFQAPFNTIARAQAAVRAAKNATPAQPITVFLRGGRYPLPHTLEFGVDDSGASADAPVTYQAYCDRDLEDNMTTLLHFPYSGDHSILPRERWNGVGDETKWRGPDDPFAQLAINKTANVLLPAPAPAPAALPPQIGNVCVDKVGVGHTCYTGSIARCVHGCMRACAAHLERKFYSVEFYAEFSHLFGKALQREEDCVEVCSLSCRGCEPVTLSGSLLLPPGTVNWTLDHTVHNSSANGAALNVFVADLKAVWPTQGIDEADPSLAVMITTLYLNDLELPRAGFPNCHIFPGHVVAAEAFRTNGTFVTATFNCSYVNVARAINSFAFAYDPNAFSPRVSTWNATLLHDAVVQIHPNASIDGNLLFSLNSINSSDGRIDLGAGGAQISQEVFANGPFASDNGASMSFRVENVLEELDSPGEWYFDRRTRKLYLTPVNSSMVGADLTAASIEIPLLRQLVRVSGTRENQYLEPAHASSSLIESNSKTETSDLRFRHLIFSGTRLFHTDVYENVPASPWPLPRIAAFFMETVARIVVEHCTFDKIGGNALMVSGESDAVQLVNNNVSYVGAHAIALVARLGFQHTAAQSPVLAHLLYSRSPNVSFNQVHHFGRQVTHAAGIMVTAAKQAIVQGNLVFAFPSSTATNYFLKDADGAAFSSSRPLIRPIINLTIPSTLAQNLSAFYTISVPVVGLDIPVIAKLVGAPECPSGTGRVDSLYGEEYPFTYNQCSGCCSVHDATARIRILGGAVAWANASRSVVLRPGDTLELSATSSSFFNAFVDVYLAFHVVTPNQILDLDTRALWRIVTRKCRFQEHHYTAICGGACSTPRSVNANVSGCGNSNVDIQQFRALQCAEGYEPDVYSHVCQGPFQGWADCDGSGTPKAQVYYNCSVSCSNTTCT
ncbi:TPA: hypothetical protein N0F65_012769 [Lagenidium giganteum]|uniref:Uncharacterized protein n=1 Tax=Lagenidium giganteum TaxID=4803 RepID=A0AAV2YHK5_9STRA|nr:TPA: hypothetical protein N0F65_012769 [Lagenidium giganteum]